LWKQTEHETIVMDWKEAFGRLPPGASLDHDGGGDKGSSRDPFAMATVTPPPPPRVSMDELKESLGIVDQAQHDWDDEWEWTDDENEAASPPVPPAPAAVGLRPGGRVA
jgi:hypothetical protein